MLSLISTTIFSSIWPKGLSQPSPSWICQPHLTIDHTILLDKLNVHYGISELALGWFKSYLSGRTHWVKVGNTLSHPSALQYGVPQGSVLGPILFSLYTNPISSIIHSHSSINHHFYADDTQLYITLTPTNFSHSIQKLKNCLSDIQNFMSANKLKLNPEKTEFILIGSKNNRKQLLPHFPINIIGNQVSPAQSVRNLGVVFDSNFSFSDHVSQVIKSTRVHARDLYRIRPLLDLNTSVLLDALVSSRLDYCNNRKQLLPHFPINILGNQVSPAQRVRNLGVVFDSNFSFSDHVSQVIKSTRVHARDLYRIHPLLDLNTSVLLDALVSSRLDYCNSLFLSLTDFELRRLKLVQNSLCRVVTRSSKYCHITPQLKKTALAPYQIQDTI